MKKKKVLLVSFVLVVGVLFLGGIKNVLALVSSGKYTAPSVYSGLTSNTNAISLTAEHKGVRGNEVEFEMVAGSSLNSKYFSDDSTRAAVFRIFEDDQAPNADEEIAVYIFYFNGRTIDKTSKTRVSLDSGLIDGSDDATAELYHSVQIAARNGDSHGASTGLYTYRYHIMNN